MNIPQFLRENEPYSAFNREERNVAAILYHLLLVDGNLARFANLIGADIDTDPQKVEVYYEFAYLRDLWHRHTDNEQRRALILQFLQPSAKHLRDASIADFNQFFGPVPTSTKYIQSPGRWTVKGLAKSIDDDEEFLRTCWFKWAFNIKPDLVLIDQTHRAICLEAKVESGEGSYPTAASEKEEFTRRGLKHVHQTELQRYLMNELLGLRTTFVFLTCKPAAKSPNARYRRLPWKETFKALRHETCPPFIQDWIRLL